MDKFLVEIYNTRVPDLAHLSNYTIKIMVLQWYYNVLKAKLHILNALVKSYHTLFMYNSWVLFAAQLSIISFFRSYCAVSVHVSMKTKFKSF